MINIGKAKAHLHQAEQALAAEEWKTDPLGAIAHALTGCLDLYIEEIEEAEQEIREAGVKINMIPAGPVPAAPPPGHDMPNHHDNVIELINTWVDMKNEGSNVLNLEYAIKDLRTAIGDNQLFDPTIDPTLEICADCGKPQSSIFHYTNMGGTHPYVSHSEAKP